MGRGFEPLRGHISTKLNKAISHIYCLIALFNFSLARTTFAQHMFSPFLLKSFVEKEFTN